MIELMNTQHTNSMNPTYVIIRILQRLSLLSAGFFAFLLCSFLVSQSVIFTAITTLKNYQGYTSPDGLNQTLEYFINDFTWFTLYSVLAGVILTVGLSAFKSQRSADKKTIIDSFVILGFCLFTTVFAQTFLKMFISHLAG